MMPQNPDPTIHIDQSTVKKLTELADNEGRSFQSLMDEALADFLQKKAMEQIRPHMRAAYQASLDQFDLLYKKLAEQD